ncbi:MMPL family transporter [Nocardioides psychrotolerans]|uniref:MMPL family transporter n=1 Tax=Nocardioides psychrotolerans TaxID=1005945 RepID=UPI0031381CD0
MATFLYRVGRTAFRRRWTFIGSWFLILLALGGLAGAFGKSADAQLSIPGVESVEATELLQDRLPDSGAGGPTARMVFAAPDGAKVTDPAYQAAIMESLAAAGSAELVASVSDPFETQTVSQDGQIAYATVSYSGTFEDLTPEVQDELVAAEQPAEDAGLQVELGGEATQATAEQSATEIIGVGVALIVLVVTFGSLLAAGLPLITALFGVGAGMAGVTALSSVVDLTSTAPTLGLMIGLAVGIDYALFIAIRHQENLAQGMPAHEAAATAVGTAGSAVVFAGATVMIALAGLAVVGIPFLTTMGLVAAGMVAMAVLVALTLVPAVLGLAGERFSRWPVPGLKKRQANLAAQAQENAAGEGKEPFGARWARIVTRRPVAFLLAGIIGTGMMAVPVLGLELGLPDDGNLAETTTQRKAYDLLADGFGKGFNGPLTLVIDAQDTTGAGGVQQAAEATVDAITGLDNVVAVTPPVITPGGDTAILSVIPESGPAATETKDLVHEIREVRGDVESATGADVLVTGNTAVGIDISDKLTNALPIFLLIVIGISLVLLMIAFRSIVVPIKATLGFLLSLGATFGALVFVFQQGHLAGLIGLETTGPIISFLPILLVGLLFGLAMDYEVFLVSRMREDYVHGATPVESVVGGFRHGARVVTAAALIMASVFAGFILGDDATIKSIGFALAFGVLIDAFVIRMTLVPAAMALLGDKAWYLPAWLERILPNVDIEGAALEHRTGNTTSAADSDSTEVRQPVG